MTEYHPRDIADAVNTALKNMPVVVVTGMRQTGKTTFLCSQPDLADRVYVSFDDFAQLEAAKSDLDGFFSRSQPLSIDEAHKCPEIFVAIKKAVDKKKNFWPIPAFRFYQLYPFKEYHRKHCRAVFISGDLSL